MGVTSFPATLRHEDHRYRGGNGAKRQRSSRRIITAAVLSLGLVAAACGSDDDSAPIVSQAADVTTAEAADTTVAESTDTTVEAPTDTEAAPTTEAGLEPVAGGSIVMGIEADTSSPWRPYEMLCAISCHQVIRNIYDTLAMPTADGKAAPYLAESITPNDDFTEWTHHRPLRRHVPRRHAVRRRGDRRQPHTSEDRRPHRQHLPTDRHRRPSTRPTR